MLVLFINACTTPKQQEQAPLSSTFKEGDLASTQFKHNVLSDWKKLIPLLKQDQQLSAIWPSFLASCQSALALNPLWKPICLQAKLLGEEPESTTILSFLREQFDPWQIINKDGSQQGLITGYYEPLILASETPSNDYKWPIYGVPRDLLSLQQSQKYAFLRNKNLRGRKVGNKVYPYWTRSEINTLKGNFPAEVLLWAKDPIELFFLQIQGSGRAQLPDGRMLHLGFADNNGHPYQSIGTWLIQHGELSFEQASMQGIKNWVQQHPNRLQELLNVNSRYVFFRILPENNRGPIGALGVPLTAERSIAVDRRFIPLGAPVLLSTTLPLSNQAMIRLTMAQDTGSAIIGSVRADYFWGFGRQAEQQAGRMRQQGQLWVLWPKGHTPTKK